MGVGVGVGSLIVGGGVFNLGGGGGGGPLIECDIASIGTKAKFCLYTLKTR